MQKLNQLARLSLALSLLTPLAIPAVAEAQEVCGRRFFLSNPTSEPVAVTIHSATRVNLSWSPNLRNIDRATAKKIANAAGKAMVAGGAATAKTGVGAVIAGVGAIAVAAGDPTLDAIYNIYDARMATRTIVLPANARNFEFTIQVPFACRFERRYALSAICPPADQAQQKITYLPSERSRDFTGAETLRATVCR